MNSILITNSGIDKHTGGGNVGYHLYLALKKYTDLLAVIGVSCNNLDILFESLHPYKYKQPDSSFLYDYFALKNLMQLLGNFGKSFEEKRKKRIDLTFFYACPFGLTAHWLKQTYPNIKIIADLAPHNIEISREEHYKFGLDYDKMFPHLVDNDLWMLYTEHLRLADVVIVHSKQSAKYIKEKAKLHIEPIVIPHGCYLPEKIEYPEKFIVGALNVAGIDKGLIYTLLAWKKFQPKLSWFYVAGSRTEMWADFMRKQQIPNARIFGRVTNVSEFYNKCSIMCFSTVSEGFGICILESMAHGKPVIVAEGAGASEIVEDGKEGFVVPIRDVNAVVDKIKYFRENPDEIKRMGRNAREKAKRYTWDKIIEEYEKVIKDDKLSNR